MHVITSKLNALFYGNIPADTKIVANVCKELLSIRDGLCIAPITATECSQLIEYLCTI